MIIFEGDDDMVDENNFNEESIVNFKVTVGKSYKNKGWAVKRSSLNAFVPELPYEKECTLYIEETKIPAKINIHTRLFYFKNKQLSYYLEELADIDEKSLLNIDLVAEHGNYHFKKSNKDSISFKTTFSKSFKSGMFALPREYTNEILPILPYETKCNFYVGDLKVDGKFNLEFRLRFNSKLIVPKLELIKEEGEEIYGILLLD